MREANSAPYIYQKRDIFYFSRRVPSDLIKFYKCPKITLSLRTKSIRSATAKSLSLAAQLEDEWMTLRWRQSDSPLRRFMLNQGDAMVGKSDAPLLSAVREIYIQSKGVKEQRHQLGCYRRFS